MVIGIRDENSLSSILLSHKSVISDKNCYHASISGANPGFYNRGGAKMCITHYDPEARNPLYFGRGRLFIRPALIKGAGSSSV